MNKEIKHTLGFPHKAQSHGGPGSFQRRLMAVLEPKGWRIVYPEDNVIPDVILIVGGGTKKLSWLRKLKMRGIPVVYKLNGLNWIHAYSRAQLKGKLLNLARNCVFEPSLNGNPENEMLKCLKQVSEAFAWGKSAIITTHRLTFIGTIDAKNRERNLKYFNMCLDEITKRWSGVNFINPSDLKNLLT